MRKAIRNHPGLALFAGVWLIYGVCPPFLSYDSYWPVATAVSLVENGTTRVDRFIAAAPVQADYGVECVPATGAARMKYAAEGCPGGHWYSYYPVGTPVLVAPLFLVIKGALAVIGPVVPRGGFFARREIAAFFSGDLLNGRPLTELFCGSLIGALTVWVQYRIALLFLPFRAALGFAALFAFGTAEWSVASRNLYPHGLTLLLLSGALFFLLPPANSGAALRAGTRYALAGLLLALGFCVRPSNAISAVALAVYVAVHQRRHLAAFVLGAAPVAVLFFSYQALVQHSLIPLYVYVAAQQNNISFAAALALSFLSPSRGVFVFTPVFLVSVAGIWLGWRRRWCFPMLPYLIAIVIFHTLLVTTIWPGHCFGPRYFADITHLLILFLIPAFLWWRERSGNVRRILATGFLLVAACGIFVNGRGATSIAVNQWSAWPVNVDDARWRVWDWRDPQFLRGLR